MNNVKLGQINAEEKQVKTMRMNLYSLIPPFNHPIIEN